MRETAVSVANPLTDKWRMRVPENLSPDDDVTTLDELARAVDKCKRCPLYCNATQGVAGEGPKAARIMLVGEQPGDQEDRSEEHTSELQSLMRNSDAVFCLKK